MNDLKTYIDSLEKAKGNRRAALNNYNAAREEYDRAFTPLGTPDEADLRSLLSVCRDAAGFSASSIFICAALVYYCPEAIYGGRIPLDTARAISSVLNVTAPAIYIARNKVCSWLSLYPEFFRSVYRAFEHITSLHS